VTSQSAFSGGCVDEIRPQPISGAISISFDLFFDFFFFFTQCASPKALNPEHLKNKKGNKNDGSKNTTCFLKKIFFLKQCARLKDIIPKHLKNKGEHKRRQVCQGNAHKKNTTCLSVFSREKKSKKNILTCLSGDELCSQEIKFKTKKYIIFLTRTCLSLHYRKLS
jgi:hypothetical protein